MKNGDGTRVNALLRGVAPETREAGYGRWRVPLSNGIPFAVGVRVDLDWLLLESPMDFAQEDRDPWKMLLINARIPGLSKLAVSVQSRAPRLCAEIPLINEVLERELPVALAGMERAHEIATTKEGAGPYRVSSTTSGREEKMPPEPSLLEALTKAGWSHREQANRDVSVRLDTGGGARQALLRPETAADLSVFVDLETVEDASEVVRKAIGLFLLQASGIVRMVRASVKKRENTSSIQFEIRLQRSSAPAQLPHALSAMSVACRYCAQEVRALKEESVSREYLAVRGWPS